MRHSVPSLFTTNRTGRRSYAATTAALAEAAKVAERVTKRGPITGLRLSHPEQMEVTFPRHACRAQVVLNDKHGHGSVFRDYDGPDHSGLGEYHVIALFANAAETIGFENPDQTFVGDRTKLWHAPAAGVTILAGWR